MARQYRWTGRKAYVNSAVCNKTYAGKRKAKSQPMWHPVTISIILPQFSMAPTSDDDEEAIYVRHSYR